MTDTTQTVVKHIDTLLDGIAVRPLMYGGSMHATELLASHLLDLRAIALDIETPDYRAWLFKQYPDVPGSVRSVAYAVRWRHGEQEHREVFQRELAKMIDELCPARNS